MGRPQLRAGLYAELVDQGVSRGGVDAPSLRLPTTGVQGKHQLPGQPLVEWPVGYCGHQFRYDVGMAAAGEVEIYALAQDLVALFYQPLPMGSQVAARGRPPRASSSASA